MLPILQGFYIISLGGNMPGERDWLVSALYNACSEGRLSLVKCLIENEGVSAHTVFEDGKTLLHLACAKYRLELVWYLKDTYHLSVHTQDKMGVTPLYEALATRMYSEDKLFMPFWYYDRKSLACKEEINIKLKNGKTMLHIACINQELILAQDLIHYGAKIYIRDEEGNTPLDIACAASNKELVRICITETCLRADECVYVYNGEPHHYSVISKVYQDCDTALATLLIEHKAKLDVPNEDGHTALDIACINGCLDAVKYLIPLQIIMCSSNTFDERYKAIVASYAYGHLDIVDYLINNNWVRERGALSNTNRSKGIFVKQIDVNTKYEILNLAYENRDLDIMRYLTVKWPEDGNKFLYNACSAGTLGLVKYLVEECQVNQNAPIGYHGCVPLDIAIDNDEPAVFMWLVDNKADINAADLNGRTPIYGIMSPERSLEDLKYLIKYGAVLDVAMNDGWTLLHQLCHRGIGNSECSKILQYLVLEQGLNPHIPTDDGRTPLYTSCRRGYISGIKFLFIDQGADPLALTTEGDTPFNCADFEIKWLMVQIEPSLYRHFVPFLSAELNKDDSENKSDKENGNTLSTLLTLLASVKPTVAPMSVWEVANPRKMIMEGTSPGKVAYDTASSVFIEEAAVSLTGEESDDDTGLDF